MSFKVFHKNLSGHIKASRKNENKLMVSIPLKLLK